MRCVSFLFLLITAQLSYCLASEYRSMTGEIINEFPEGSLPSPRIDSSDKVYLLRHLHAADSIYRVTGKIEDYSNLGAMCAYNGQHIRAKNIFLGIEKKSSGLYQAASNLGTIYELLGQNDSAYYWVKKAIERKPGDQGGSEWIHLKILEAKMKANGDDQYLEKNSILELGFGNSVTPVNSNGLDLDKLRNDLYHQLSERLSFAKAPDLVVGQLFADLGDVYVMQGNDHIGMRAYGQARAYGYSTDLLIEKTNKFFQTALKDIMSKSESWTKKNDNSGIKNLRTILAVISVLLLIGSLILRNKEKSN